MDSTSAYANVRVAGNDSPIIVPITSKDKPEINSVMREKWQNIADLMVRIVKVPVGLIMKLEEKNISVFISAGSKASPYHAGDSEILDLGLYCETVTAKRKGLLVPDAREDRLWETNPDIELGMVSYLGYPIQWPDGEIFGTICILDNKKNSYTNDFDLLVKCFRDILNDDLSLLLENQKLIKENLGRKIEKRELHHRLKNNFNVLLSSIQLELGKKHRDPEGLLNKILFSLRALSAIHEELYTNEKLSFKNVMSDIISNLADLYSYKNLTIDSSVDDIAIDINTINTYIFILNELITNSIKHAFADTASPRITLQIKQKKSQVLLIYKDNGIGIEEINYKKSNSLGKTLLEILPQQINGRLKNIDYKKALFIFEFRVL